MTTEHKFLKEYLILLESNLEYLKKYLDCKYEDMINTVILYTGRKLNVVDIQKTKCEIVELETKILELENLLRINPEIKKLKKLKETKIVGLLNKFKTNDSLDPEDSKRFFELTSSI